MNKLPFLISIPHGGTVIPNEVKNEICITTQDLFDDSDSFTQEIYNVSEVVESVVMFDIARAFVDVSRAENMLPPEFTDGVIKSATCYNKPIYKNGFLSNKEVIKSLLDKYYQPYHTEIKTSLENKNIKLALDCHSMAEFAPSIAPDKGKRPLINLGDAEGKACDSSITKLLRESFIEVFHLNAEDVTINHPFKGGYITKTYGNNPKPFIQIELNRSMYLSNIDNNILVELNSAFIKVLFNFYNKFKPRIANKIL